jgi:rare lipoprotein A
MKFEIWKLFSALLIALFLTSCATVPTFSPEGVASWYGKQFQGKKTASGERFDMNDLTAAHRTLPFGSKIRVTSLSTHKSVVVRINDRGPFARGRIIDLSYEAARRIGLIEKGEDRVILERL